MAEKYGERREYSAFIDEDETRYATYVSRGRDCYRRAYAFCLVSLAPQVYYLYVPASIADHLRHRNSRDFASSQFQGTYIALSRRRRMQKVGMPSRCRSRYLLRRRRDEAMMMMARSHYRLRASAMTVNYRWRWRSTDSFIFQHARLRHRQNRQVFHMRASVLGNFIGSRPRQAQESARQVILPADEAATMECI